MAESTVTAPQLTAEQVQHLLVQPLEAQSVFLAAGPRIFDTNGSQVRIPKLGGPTARPWIGEGELIPDADVAFDEIVLLPSTMKSVKTLTRFSNELARQSVVNLTTALQTRLVRDVAATIDNALIAGNGDGVSTPKGLLNYTGVQTIAVGGVLSLDNLLDAWGLALAANVNMASLRWFLTPGTFTGLRKLKTTQGQYLLQPDPTANGVFRLWGAPDGHPAHSRRHRDPGHHAGRARGLRADRRRAGPGAVRRGAGSDLRRLRPARAQSGCEVRRGADESRGRRSHDRHHRLMTAPARGIDPDDVTRFLGRDIDVERVADTVATVTAMARAYTRGRGFDVDGNPYTDVRAVILTATCRLVTNPAQKGPQTVGGISATPAVFAGWTLAERLTLDRYRVKAL